MSSTVASQSLDRNIQVWKQAAAWGIEKLLTQAPCKRGKAFSYELNPLEDRASAGTQKPKHRFMQEGFTSPQSAAKQPHGD